MLTFKQLLSRAQSAKRPSLASPGEVLRAGSVLSRAQCAKTPLAASPKSAGRARPLSQRDNAALGFAEQRGTRFPRPAQGALASPIALLLVIWRRLASYIGDLVQGGHQEAIQLLQGLGLPTRGINLFYVTGWSVPRCHHRRQDGSWGALPGTPCSLLVPGLAFIHVDKEELEFVMNDGGSSWDNPPQSTNAANYRIGQPGVYILCTVSSAKTNSILGMVPPACRPHAPRGRPPVPNKMLTFKQLLSRAQSAKRPSLASPGEVLRAGSVLSRAQCAKTPLAASPKSAGRARPLSQRDNAALGFAEQRGTRFPRPAQGALASPIALLLVIWRRLASYIGDLVQGGHQEAIQLLQGLGLPTRGINLFYVTGWSAPRCHHRRQDGSWGALPGTPCSFLVPGLAFIHVDQEELEFVMNDGGSSWDSPPQSTNAANYRIGQPGVYILCTEYLRSEEMRAVRRVVRRVERAARKANQSHIVYVSGWRQPYVHHSVEGGGWTALPGVPCQQLGDSGSELWHVCMKFHEGLQFVPTDGTGSWDHPSVTDCGPNYYVPRAGVFLLCNGQLRQLRSMSSSSGVIDMFVKEYRCIAARAARFDSSHAPTLPASWPSPPPQSHSKDLRPITPAPPAMPNTLRQTSTNTRRGQPTALSALPPPPSSASLTAGKRLPGTPSGGGLVSFGGPTAAAAAAVANPVTPPQPFSHEFPKQPGSRMGGFPLPLPSSMSMAASSAAAPPPPDSSPSLGLMKRPPPPPGPPPQEAMSFMPPTPSPPSARPRPEFNILTNTNRRASANASPSASPPSGPPLPPPAAAAAAAAAAAPPPAAAPQLPSPHPPPPPTEAAAAAAAADPQPPPPPPPTPAAPRPADLVRGAIEALRGWILERREAIVRRPLWEEEEVDEFEEEVWQDLDPMAQLLRRAEELDNQRPRQGTSAGVGPVFLEQIQPHQLIWVDRLAVGYGTYGVVNRERGAPTCTLLYGI
ncbi:unnamed protein product [Vitrella brassicaformis CCMP3155]|uniref:Carbohydrate binding module family 25 domain-containing protein n=1 Tax=Vitrella brassicaformis (strain CCMP3155) TaxID=1169540 RepID=A0A0G4F7X1_VITBC|nr:unnamed protein product [Vitrella brassicaformis CCMP3155]|eukprot:CEM08790.1 unnamed protein product [Vitrella brassicaformis CCMP3155]